MNPLMKLNPCPYCNSKLVLQIYLSSLGEPIGNLYCMDKECHNTYTDFHDQAGLDELLEEYGWRDE